MFLHQAVLVWLCYTSVLPLLSTSTPNCSLRAPYCQNRQFLQERKQSGEKHTRAIGSRSPCCCLKGDPSTKTTMEGHGRYPPGSDDPRGSIDSTLSEYSVIAIGNAANEDGSLGGGAVGGSRISADRERGGEGREKKRKGDRSASGLSREKARVLFGGNEMGSTQGDTFDREYLDIEHYRESHLRLVLFYMLCVLPLPIPGMFLLVARWFPELFTWIAREKVDGRFAWQAEYVLVRGPAVEAHHTTTRTQSTLPFMRPRQAPSSSLTLAPNAAWVELPVASLSLPAPLPDTSLSSPVSSTSPAPLRRRKSTSSRMESDDDMEDDTNNRPRSSLKGDASAVSVRFFDYRHQRYVFDPRSNSFTRRLATISAYGQGVYDGSLATGKPLILPQDAKESSRTDATSAASKTVSTTNTQQPSTSLSIPSIVLSLLASFPSGLSTSHHAFLSSLHLPNLLTPPTHSLASLLLSKISTPFYIFQIFAAVVWALEGYFTFSAFVILCSSAGVAWEAILEKQNQTRIQSLAAVQPLVRVLRNAMIGTVPASSLVPGDIVCFLPSDADPSTSSSSPTSPHPSGALPHATHALLAADFVLTSGTVVADESTLTGETVPVVKSPFHPGTTTTYHEDRHRNATLFAGSRIVQVKPAIPALAHPGAPGYATAIVVRTGFATAKGEVFRSVIHPTQVEIAFRRDAWRVLGVMAAVGVIASAKRLYDGITFSRPLFSIILTSLDILTTAIPPALPIVLTVGTGMSLTRLRSNRVLCIDPDRINLAGRVDAACWDKTGTLTETGVRFVGLDKWEAAAGFCGIERSVGGNAGRSSSARRNATPLDLFGGNVPLVMAVCHGLNVVDGALAGYSLDTELFTATGCSLVQPAEMPVRLPSASATAPGGVVLPLAHVVLPPRLAAPEALHVLKRFDFDPTVQRASVVVALSAASGPWVVAAKGSPEAMWEACEPSTLPDRAVFEATLRGYTARGFYVLACGTREVSGIGTAGQLEALRREDVENRLRFAGFVLLRNPVKTEAAPLLHSLAEAGIRNVMITGDDVRTGVHVAREVGIVGARRPVFIIDVEEDSSTGGPKVMFYEVAGEDVQVAVGGPQGDGPKRPLGELRRWMSAAPTGVELAIRASALEALKDQAGFDALGDGSAVAGDAGAKEKRYLLDWIVKRCSVFGRVKPAQKAWIVQRLMGMGETVAMCGDGTNDCGALKAAHVGLALSDSEASVVAPFTSAKLEVTDMMAILLEGRTLNNNQWLIDDIFIVTGLAFWMVYTGPATKLSLIPPADSLFHIAVVASLAGQIALFVWFFALVSILMYAPAEAGWFCSVDKATQFLSKVTLLPKDPSLGAANFPCYPVDPNSDVVLGQLQKSMENTVFWLFAHFQFLVTALGVTIVARHRQPFWTNRFFVVYLVLLFSILTFMLLTPDDAPWAAGMNNAFSMRSGVPLSFRFKVWAVALADLVVCGGLWELVVVDKAVPWVQTRWQTRSKVGSLKRAPSTLTRKSSLKPGASATRNQGSWGLTDWISRPFRGGSRLGSGPSTPNASPSRIRYAPTQILRRTQRDPVSEDEMALIDRSETRRTVAEAEAFGDSPTVPTVHRAAVLVSPERTGSPNQVASPTTTSPVSSPVLAQPPSNVPLGPTLKSGGRHLSQRRAERRAAAGSSASGSAGQAPGGSGSR
ncbi:hypothetical protein M427DRAFT_44373 [Gonapodya prolifera JEL478]|uniref:Cation-transporting ATPase n=1 Tax=Gonapodya prolifera (strain JEL478) TaxID=1344416 RepID=A0A139AFI2_GONPJ|nr:hypothetical protein M427DRAFT_44373 [Gonapodya prolifera JEL478]|eukprot:KXS15518.1 hypothetical protein M427DRAFT_44373 [Gonapodya prolifera JEL478]